MEHYMLDPDGNITVTTDVLVWGRWMEENPEQRIIRQSGTEDGPCISTVFLGTDYSFSMGGPPILFETMHFSGPGLEDGGECIRSRTREEALIRHAQVCEHYAIENTEGILPPAPPPEPVIIEKKEPSGPRKVKL